MKVLYKNVDIYPSININRMWYTMNAEKETDELIIKFNDVQKEWDGWNPTKNDEIKIIDGSINSGKMYVNTLTRERGLFVLRARSAPSTMWDVRNKTWVNIFLLQIAQEIATRHGLVLETYGVTNYKYTYATQTNKSDLAYLQELCELEGLSFIVYDGKLIIYSDEYMESQTPLETLEVGSDVNYEYTDNASGQYGKIKLINGAFIGTAEVSNGSSKEATRIINSLINTQDEANRYAKHTLRNINKYCTNGTLWYPSLLKGYAAGSTLNITTGGAASFDGAIFISKVRHDFINSTTKLEFRRVT